MLSNFITSLHISPRGDASEALDFGGVFIVVAWEFLPRDKHLERGSLLLSAGRTYPKGLEVM